MKANELREMQTAELTSKLADLKAELLDVYKRQVHHGLYHAPGWAGGTAEKEMI